MTKRDNETWDEYFDRIEAERAAEEEREAAEQEREAAEQLARLKAADAEIEAVINGFRSLPDGAKAGCLRTWRIHDVNGQQRLVKAVGGKSPFERVSGRYHSGSRSFPKIVEVLFRIAQGQVRDMTIAGISANEKRASIWQALQSGRKPLIVRVHPVAQNAEAA